MYLDRIARKRHEEGGRVGVVHHDEVGPEVVEVVLQLFGLFLRLERSAKLERVVQPLQAVS